MPTTLALGADHAGFARKEALKTWLEGQGYAVQDFGTHSEASVDYPDFAHPLAAAVAAGQPALGILLCGSANGVCITANKHAGVRAALAWLPEIATLARQHNNANVLCLPARYLTDAEAAAVAGAFLAASFEGGRHQRRVEKMDEGNFGC